MLGVAEQSRKMFPDYENVEKWMNSYGFQSLADRLREIVQDARQGSSVTVAFCGLFSAGKSSLINVLIGEATMGTGAVPTTASVDEVFLGQIGDGIRILDTPGVDSTDEAHRQATMNALHRADVICLVADYQHVEAQENLDLLRSFTDEGKRLVLVVNQVDKHLDFELSMDDFSKHVETTLDDYAIVVERVFYTSTKDVAHSELADFEQWLRHLKNVNDADRLDLVHKRLHDLVEDAVSSLYRPQFERVEEGIAKAFGYAPLDINEAKDWFAEVEHQLEDVNRQLTYARQEREQVHLRKREEWIRTVELAQISPYATTEKGRHYVESMRPDFKMGWLRSAKRTNAERDRRAHAFVDDLADHVLHYLITPLHNQLYRDIQDIPWARPDWLAGVERVSVDLNVNYVERQLKSGALGSTQYPYQYVRDVVSRIKRDVMALLVPMVDDWFARATDDFTEDYRDLWQKLQTLNEKSSLLKTYLVWHEQCKAEVDSLLAGGEQ